MCIALLCTSHPDYPFILLNNRDEYLTRPTARATFWDPPNSHVLGGRDLQRAIRGTWLGITKQGRLAVLTNYREQGQEVSGLKSRGAMVNSFLTQPPDSVETTEEFAKRLVEEVGVTDVGGFSLVFGRLAPFESAKGRKGLAIVSNRSEHVGDVTWVAEGPGEVHGLSNSFFGDRSWPKVVQGERKLERLVRENVEAKAGKQDLIDRLVGLLSLNTLPKRKEGEDWDTYLYQLRNSILIPKIGGEDIESKAADSIAAADSKEEVVVISGNGHYATQKQTVILVDKKGTVTFIEKTLYDEDCRPLENSKEEFTFDIEGWGN
ncbi:NRDE protein-domain-containing protein [Delphinella strobiligena]|nr:NRDE protein-domain-containing protein [Delphinella strobiligena]